VIADRFGTRLTGVALCWTALTFALIGFAPSFPLLLVVACASGLGSGAFHPLGALDVRALLPAWRRSFGMSVYVTAGTVGVAFGPLIGILLFAALGIHGTGVLVIPGIATGSYLLWRMRSTARPAARHRAPAAGQAVPVFALAMVIGVMMSRSWTVGVFQAFTPTWYAELGYGPGFYGPLVTTLVLASAIGTVGCGSLADRFGRRTVILATLVLSAPAILLYTLFPGPWAFVSAILIGFLAASTAPLMLLMAQQLMASRAGLASGLVMGLGFVTAAIGVPINGAIADAIGLQKSLMTHVILVLGTILIAWFLPREEEMERHAVRQREAQPAVAP
jgi:FSR family fosmidomycin resistance protein-like MFS transporter